MGYYFRPPAPRHSDDGTVSFLVGCIAGLVVGGALGVLLAPHRGEITRRKIVRHAGEAKDQVIEVVEDQLENMRERKGADVGEEAAE